MTPVQKYAKTAARIIAAHDFKRGCKLNWAIEQRCNTERLRLNEVCLANQSTVDLYKRERDTLLAALQACMFFVPLGTNARIWADAAIAKCKGD